MDSNNDGYIENDDVYTWQYHYNGQVDLFDGIELIEFEDTQEYLIDFVTIIEINDSNEIDIYKEEIITEEKQYSSGEEQYYFKLENINNYIVCTSVNKNEFYILSNDRNEGVIL